MVSDVNLQDFGLRLEGILDFLGGDEIMPVAVMVHHAKYINIS